MKRIIAYVAVVLALVGCAPSEAELQDAVAEAISATQQAIPTATEEPTATATPRATNTPTPTNTPRPTFTLTPRPTRTSSPTATPAPTLEPEMIALGGRCVDQITNDSYIFMQEGTNALWGSLSPAIIGYVTESDGDYELVMDFHYVGNDWLFVDELIFNVDGEVIHMTPVGISTDVLGGGRILESGTVIITPSVYVDFFKVIDGEDVKLRYSGSDGSFDAVPDAHEMNTLRYANLISGGLQDGSINLADFEEVCPG